MNELFQYADTIKSHVTMQQAIALYAPNSAPRQNRIPCPIHNGDNYNLHYSDKLYHCFVCGEGGDVIKFVQHIFKINFMCAVRKINEDFGLNLPLDRKPTLREQREAEIRQRELAAERAEKRHKQAYDLEQFNRFVHFNDWLREQKQTESVMFDTAFIGRLLDQHTGAENYITFDALALIEALLSKHDNADTFKWFWKEENQDFPTYEEFYAALFDGLIL